MIKKLHLNDLEQMFKRNLIWYVLLLQVNVYCQQFSEVSNILGIEYTLNSSDGWGAGVSFYDFDNDGLDDLTLVLENDYVQLYRNTGSGFEALPPFAFSSGKTRQAIWVDYDNDGYADLFVTTSGPGSCKLYRNQTDGSFVDVTVQSGLFGLNSFNYGATFADYNKDGFIDLYLCRYILNGNSQDPLQVNALFRNNGDGTFTNVSIEAGVSNGTQPSFIGIWIDINSNGWPDLYVINDRASWQNTLYLNNGDGTFTDATTTYGAGMPSDDPMSGTFADFDNDGDLDIYSTNTGTASTPSRLLLNEDGLLFSEVADERGVALNKWGWGSAFLDVDNDSNLDLFVATGYVFTISLPEVESHFFINNGQHSFEIAPASYVDTDLTAASYGVAIGDANGDGYQDVFVVNAENYNSFLLLNEGGSNNYIKVTLAGVASNKMAIGSWISVYVAGEKFVHYTRCGENYCGQNSHHHIFGLSNADLVDSLVVLYPSGHKDVYFNLQANSHYYFTEGETYYVTINSVESNWLCMGDSILISVDNHSSYTWSTGETTQTIYVEEPGTYWVTVTNQFGLSVQSVPVTIQWAPESTIDYQINHISCFGETDGSITVTFDNNQPPVSILWNTGNTTSTIENLDAGIYSFLGVNYFGCPTTGSAMIESPSPISATYNVSDVLCFGENTGSISVTPIGGTTPYSINWGEINPNALNAGVYSILVSDTNLCFTELSIVIEEPTPLNIELWYTNFEEPNNLGTAGIIVAGGTPPYSFEWSNGEIDVQDIYDLKAGEYSVSVIDANGCESNQAFTILNITGVEVYSNSNIKVFPNPFSFNLFIDNYNNTEISFQLYNAQGLLILQEFNTKPPFQISTPHLAEGIYFLNISDKHQFQQFKLVKIH
jgi:hypothetical protein